MKEKEKLELEKEDIGREGRSVDAISHKQNIGQVGTTSHGPRINRFDVLTSMKDGDDEVEGKVDAAVNENILENEDAKNGDSSTKVMNVLISRGSGKSRQEGK